MVQYPRRVVIKGCSLIATDNLIITDNPCIYIAATSVCAGILFAKKGYAVIGKCDRCGNEKEIVARGLCGGCYKAFRRSSDFQYLDLTQKQIGKRYGKLLVTGVKDQRAKNGGFIVTCKCDCGNDFVTELKNLKDGSTKSCGCYRKELGKPAWNKNIKFDEANGYFQKTHIPHLTSKTPITNTSGVKGVSFNKKLQKYEAYITIRKKRIKLGFYKNLDDARKARERAEEKYFDPVLQDFSEFLQSIKESEE